LRNETNGKNSEKRGGEPCCIPIKGARAENDADQVRAEYNDETKRSN